jgi:microcystin-dependent protein
VGLPATTNIGDVSHTEIQTLNGITHSVQDQVDSKAPKEGPTFTGTVVLPSTTSVGNVTATEIGYLDGVTGSIQTQIDGKTTASYVDNAVSTAVAGVIDTAPGTLNTLNELAAALGDDPNFATTITNLIAEKISNVPGMISQYGGATAPTGWFLCEGQEVSIATYTNLYNALTTTGTVFPYGANTNGSGSVGSTHFRLPNLKGRIPVGRDSSQTEFDALGETGGAKTHTLSIAEMPAHTHTQNAHNHGTSDPGHIHEVSASSGGHPAVTNYINQGVFGVFGFTPSTVNQASGYGRQWFADVSTTGISINNATATNQNTGGGGAHNNLQPYVVINYIIRY